MVAEDLAVVETTAMEMKKEKKERKKSEKKKNKKRKKSDGDSDSDAPVKSTKSKNPIKDGKDEDKIPKKKSKKDAKSRLKSKKEEKAELMKKIPLENEDGIAYTKFQIRQMMKRVKRGLPAVATPKELEEKRQNEARLRREEEAELAGLSSNRNATDSDEDDNVSKGEDAKDDGDDKGNDINSESNQQANEISTNSTSTGICTPVQPATTDGGKPKKKPKQNKPVPADYVCAACKNEHQPLHWIYDCPFKVTVRGTNKKKKKDRGFNDPDSKKVFVSGLPFDVKAKAVEDFFSISKNCGTVAGVRLVTFEDTKRCNGQAYVSFDTDEGAQNAIRLSGTTLDAEALTSSTDGKNSKKKGKDVESHARRKELKLKVSKVLNRRKTKHAGRA